MFSIIKIQLTLYAFNTVKWSLLQIANCFFLASASSRFEKGDTNGDLFDKEAAIVKTESKQQKTTPNKMSFPILTSTGNTDKCRPNAVNS